jgi:hypothetical protein
MQGRSLCDVLALSGAGSILTAPHVGQATRLLSPLAGGSGSHGDDILLLGAPTIAEACDTVPQWAPHIECSVASSASTLFFHMLHMSCAHQQLVETPIGSGVPDLSRTYLVIMMT